jgi:hypothetical protein
MKPLEINPSVLQEIKKEKVSSDEETPGKNVDSSAIKMITPDQIDEESDQSKKENVEITNRIIELEKGHK